MNAALLQIENRSEPYFDRCMEINKEYCKQHKIDYIRGHGYDNFSPYWWKVVGILELMEKSPHFKIVAWMDSDAFVYDAAFDFRLFLKRSSKTMIVSPDPVFKGKNWGSPFMAAVFFVRNSRKGREIIRNWLQYYDSKVWQKQVTNTWTCLGCQWADDNYEQGAFAKKILPKYKDSITVLPWYILHEVKHNNPHAFTWSIHIPGCIKDNRPNYPRKKIQRENFASSEDSQQVDAGKNDQSRTIHLPFLILFLTILLIILSLYFF